MVITPKNLLEKQDIDTFSSTFLKVLFLSESTIDL